MQSSKEISCHWFLHLCGTGLQCEMENNGCCILGWWNLQNYSLDEQQWYLLSWFHKIISELLIFNGNYRPYTNTIEVITKFGYTVLLHPPFNHTPDMPSVFHLFILWKTHFEDNISWTMKYCRSASGYGRALVQRGKNTIGKNKDYFEK